MALVGKAATEEVGREMGVQLGGGGDIGGGVQSYGNLHSPEYNLIVYCNTTYSGSVRGGGEESGGTGKDKVLGTGGN